MYFQIENTPENLKRARKKKIVIDAVQEECPRLVLAPFSRLPQVVFDNVVIGSSCKKELELLNPTKNAQQITLCKTLPPGLIINLPEDWLEVEPETCYRVSMEWSPNQLTSMRETIRFTNDNRGRFDVVVIMKSVEPVRASKSKTSPGKIIKKTSKKSPVSMNKKKIEAIQSTAAIKKSAVQAIKNNFSTANKENNHPLNDYSIDSNYKYCPFDSLSSSDIRTSDLFPDMRQPKQTLYDTYDKSYRKIEEEPVHISNNILKSSNKQAYASAEVSDLFDNITFTPLKSIKPKNDKLDEGPKIIVSVNSESDFEGSVEIQNCKKENETHSIICVTSIQEPTKWVTNVYMQNDQCSVTPILHKKIPNTSSPKDFNSPNFSINTDFSRISETSFLPHRFSTERKVFPKINDETHDIVDDSNVNVKLSSDTYTKESPNTPLDYRMGSLNFDFRHLPTFTKEPHSKMSRQSLFKEQQNYKDSNERNYLAGAEDFRWHHDKAVRSPPRSPPLKSIPEEFSSTQVIINQTFDRPSELSTSRQSMWSKRFSRAETSQWKIPASIPKKSIKRKSNIKTKETPTNKRYQNQEKNRSIHQSSYLSYVDNVYSQSLTVDPFLSSTYYYDKDAVENFEKEFQRWLNCILTPPADLDSNIEKQIDVGKAWIENRNKEVPLAPTTEKVCSTYHDSRRLASLRRSARTLLRSPEISQVFLKLQAQIEKKLIAIRNDKNLHLDVGLQRITLEILLSYNPLWLRIGLEVIYGLVLPLKSNNDIEGLGTFIIQRMFRNPNLKNKKGSAPNMLLPAYMEAIKKFTLKKLFMLVFFLDQAKQKRLIPHDPCLFRRNALYKESKEIIINFTKELIWGIGDITRHLRPLGYVVSHKQSFLDEYIYAVKNIRIDMRDGVRLTKVMEIILLRKGLLHQLRTPPISRLQKIHNVQVALNALKEANFVIDGNISAADIADGHMEKTLSLLWQLIHVFRAPLFEKAATTIQTWWRKKYEVIAEKKKQEERALARLNSAASTIQIWWRQIQYNRMVEHQMRTITAKTIIIQKYWRMWLCRSRFRKLKSSIIKISEFYINYKLRIQAKETLLMLKTKKVELRHKSATLIQAYVRRWICLRRFKTVLTKVILIQSVIRGYLARKQYISLNKSIIFVQRKYRGKLLMKKEMQIYLTQKRSATKIQTWYRSLKRAKEVRQQYIKTKQACTTIQIFYKAYVAGKNQRQEFIKIKTAAVCIQKHYRNYLLTKSVRKQFIEIRKSAVVIQRFYRSWLETKKLQTTYLRIRHATITIQQHYRQYRMTKAIQQEYCKLKLASICIQQRYRSLIAMRVERERYVNLRRCVINIQRRFRALKAMRKQRVVYLRQRAAVITVQTHYRAYRKGREQRIEYFQLKTAAIKLQQRFRALKEMRKERQKYLQKRSATLTIQRRFRAYNTMLRDRAMFIKTVDACVTIQRLYRARSIGIQQRETYVRLRCAAILIQKRWREYRAAKAVRNSYIKLRHATILIQRLFRTKIENREMVRKMAIDKIQTWYTSIKRRNQCRSEFIEIRRKIINLQAYYRAYICRKRYLSLRQAAITIQIHYRNYKLAKSEKQSYVHMKWSVIKLQAYVRGFIQRRRYLKLRATVLTIQAVYRYKKHLVFLKERRDKAAVCIQSNIRRYLAQSQYNRFREKVIFIQKAWRRKLLTRLVRCEFLQKRNLVVKLQAVARGYLARKDIESKKVDLLLSKEDKRRNWAASKIQAMFIGHEVRKHAGAAAAELRRRWRNGALRSSQPTLKQRNKEAFAIIHTLSDIEAKIRAYRSLALLTEVWPMNYVYNAESLARTVHSCMSEMNRSIPSVEVMRYGAVVLVNLTRYNKTGPKIYSRDHIVPVLKYMLRFCHSDQEVFCILATYIWLFAKYDVIKKDLTEYLNMPDNRKLLVAIKSSVQRFKKMVQNAKPNLFNTPQPKCVRMHRANQCNQSLCVDNNCNISVYSNHSNGSIVLPVTDLHYGIINASRPKYFRDAKDAIHCLFDVYCL